MTTRKMRVRAVQTVTLDDESLKAYCHYHGLDPSQRAAVRKRIRETVLRDGESMLDEQIREGRGFVDLFQNGGLEK